MSNSYIKSALLIHKLILFRGRLTWNRDSMLVKLRKRYSIHSNHKLIKLQELWPIIFIISLKWIKLEENIKIRANLFVLRSNIKSWSNVLLNPKLIQKYKNGKPKSIIFKVSKDIFREYRKSNTKRMNRKKSKQKYSTSLKNTMSEC